MQLGLIGLRLRFLLLPERKKMLNANDYNVVADISLLVKAHNEYLTVVAVTLMMAFLRMCLYVSLFKSGEVFIRIIVSDPTCD